GESVGLCGYSIQPGGDARWDGRKGRCLGHEPEFRAAQGRCLRQEDGDEVSGAFADGDGDNRVVSGRSTRFSFHWHDFSQHPDARASGRQRCDRRTGRAKRPGVQSEPRGDAARQHALLHRRPETIFGPLGRDIRDAKHRYAWMSDERIRLKLKAAGYARTVNGIHLKLKRMRFKHDGSFYSASGLAQALGIDSHAVTRWIKSGHLKAKLRGTARTEQQNGDIYLIHEKDVRRFILEHPTDIDLRRVDQLWFLDYVEYDLDVQCPLVAPCFFLLKPVCGVGDDGVISAV